MHAMCSYVSIYWLFGTWNSGGIKKVAKHATDGTHHTVKQ